MPIVSRNDRKEVFGSFKAALHKCIFLGVSRTYFTDLKSNSLRPLRLLGALGAKRKPSTIQLDCH